MDIAAAGERSVPRIKAVRISSDFLPHATPGTKAGLDDAADPKPVEPGLFRQDDIVLRGVLQGRRPTPARNRTDATGCDFESHGIVGRKAEPKGFRPVHRHHDATTLLPRLGHAPGNHRHGRRENAPTPAGEDNPCRRRGFAKCAGTTPRPWPLAGTNRMWNRVPRGRRATGLSVRWWPLPGGRRSMHGRAP